MARASRRGTSTAPDLQSIRERLDERTKLVEQPRRAGHARARFALPPHAEMRIPAAAGHHLDALRRRAFGLAIEWPCWVERGVSRFPPVQLCAATAGLTIHQRPWPWRSDLAPVGRR